MNSDERKKFKLIDFRAFWAKIITKWNGLTCLLHVGYLQKDFMAVVETFSIFFQEVVLEQSKTRVYASAAPARPLQQPIHKLTSLPLFAFKSDHLLFKQ